IARDGADKKRLLPDVEPVYEQKLLRRLTGLINDLGAKNEALQEAMQALDAMPADPLTQARHCRDVIFERMQELNLNELASFLSDGLGVAQDAVARWLGSSS
ncbi:MAG: hypothetical protein IJL71_02970, partial [Oscillospiraceae bacterium]|nr:hypothetical protein [Oscillospiraceae bacterium]